MGIFPNFRGEHKKNIWVATTQINTWQNQNVAWNENMINVSYEVGHPSFQNDQQTLDE